MTRPLAWWGALERAAFLARLGFGVSSRKTLSTGFAWAVGSTFDTSQLVQLVDVGEDLAELSLKLLPLGFGEVDAGEVGDVVDVEVGGHG